MKKIFLLLMTLPVIFSCRFNRDFPTTLVAFSVPVTAGGKVIGGVTGMSDAIRGEVPGKLVSAATGEDDHEEVVFFLAALAGPNYAGVQMLDENYFKIHMDEIMSTKTIVVEFDNVPMGVDLVLNVTIGKYIQGAPGQYPLGAFQFIRKEEHLVIEPGSNVIRIVPVAESPKPMVKMASYIGGLTGCSGGVDCDFEPFGNKVIDMLFCSDISKYIEDAMDNEEKGGESPGDDSAVEEEEDTDNYDNNQGGDSTADIGETVEAPDEFYTCSECYDGEDEVDDHFLIDNNGKISTEMFAGEPLKLFVIDDSGVKHTLLDCNYTIPVPSGSNYVWDYHLIDGGRLTTGEFISRLKASEVQRLFPGYSGTYNGSGTDVDEDGVPDSMELTVTYTSPFEIDEWYGGNHYDGVWVSRAEYETGPNGIKLLFGLDTHEMNLPGDQYPKIHQCFSADRVYTGLTGFDGSFTQSSGFDNDNHYFYVKDEASLSSSYFLYKIKVTGDDPLSGVCEGSGATDQSMCEGANSGCVWTGSGCVNPCSFIEGEMTGYKHVYVASSPTAVQPVIDSGFAHNGYVIEPVENLNGVGNPETSSCNGFSNQSDCLGGTDCLWVGDLGRCLYDGLYSSGYSFQPGMYRLTVKTGDGQPSNIFLPSVEINFDAGSAIDWGFIHYWEKKVTENTSQGSYLQMNFFMGPWYTSVLSGVNINFKNAVNGVGATITSVFNAELHPDPFLSHIHPNNVGDDEYMMLYTMGDSSAVERIKLGTNYGTLWFSRSDSFFTGKYGKDGECPSQSGSFGNFFDVDRVHFVNADVGYAVVAAQGASFATYFYRTTNGGMTWSLVKHFDGTFTEDIQEMKVIDASHVWLLGWKNAEGYQIYFYDGSSLSPDRYVNGNGANIWNMEVGYNGSNYILWLVRHDGTDATNIDVHYLANAGDTLDYSSPDTTIDLGTPGLNSNVKDLVVKYNSTSGKYCGLAVTEGGQAAVVSSTSGNGAEGGGWTVTSGLSNTSASSDIFRVAGIDTCTNSSFTGYGAGEGNLFYEYDSGWTNIDGCSATPGSGNVFNCSTESLDIVDFEVFGNSEIIAVAEKDCSAESCSAVDEWSCWSTCCAWDHQGLSCFKRANAVSKIGYYSFVYNEWFHLNELEGSPNDIQSDPANRNNYYLATDESINEWYWDGGVECNNVALYHLGEVGYEQLPKTFWDGAGGFVSDSALSCGTYSVNSITYCDSPDCSSIIKTVTPAYGSKDFERDMLARNSSIATCQYDRWGENEPSFNAGSVSVSSQAYGEVTLSFSQAANCEMIDNFAAYVVSKPSGYASSANEFSFITPYQWQDWSAQDRGCSTSMTVHNLDPNMDHTLIIRAHYWGKTDGNTLMHYFAGSNMSNLIFSENFEGLDYALYGNTNKNDPNLYVDHTGGSMFAIGTFNLYNNGNTWNGSLPYCADGSAKCMKINPHDSNEMSISRSNLHFTKKLKVSFYAGFSNPSTTHFQVVTHVNGADFYGVHTSQSADDLLRLYYMDATCMTNASTGISLLPFKHYFVEYTVDIENHTISGTLTNITDSGSPVDMIAPVTPICAGASYIDMILLHLEAQSTSQDMYVDNFKAEVIP